jgi:iron complex transport system ATP-binding protein
MSNQSHTRFTQASLSAEALQLGYRDQVIIPNLSLTLPEGKVTAIVGPNGCGKSTLLSALARLSKPQSGQVLLDGKMIQSLPSREVARRLALLPQEAEAPEGMTAFELIRFGRQPHQGLFKQWSQEDEWIVEKALRAADILPLAHRPLDEMSGGQRQRAWIAMAMAQSTPILLLDEPTSALDLGHQIEVYELIRHLSQNKGKTVVMVVHDLSSACRYADHLIAMKEGSVIAEGAPSNVVTEALVEALYSVKCTLLRDPVSGTPVIAGVTSV